MFTFSFKFRLRWSVGAVVLGKLPVPGRPTNLDSSRARPTALTVGAGGWRGEVWFWVEGGGVVLDIFFSHLSFLTSFFLSLGGGPI